MRKTLTQIIKDTTKSLSSPESVKGLLHQKLDHVPLPSNSALEDIIQLTREILLPGYFGQCKVGQDTLDYYIGVSLENLYSKLKKQVVAGLCFDLRKEDGEVNIEPIRERAALITTLIIERLPKIREVLATDIEAAYKGDPAAMSFGEIIACYPVIRTLCNYRFAHELHELGVPLIPRMITEMGHSETGIDIHPAAKIGTHFTIDHGTGVVIGSTSIIGNRVKLYQGVTLGALSFPLDRDGNPIKGIPRHPIIGDDVVIYSNASILGRITIGDRSVIGANKWITENVAPDSKIYTNFRSLRGFENGTGI